MKTLSRDGLKRMMDDKEDFVLIDARTHEGFEDGHLPGAVKIPSDRLGEQAVRNYGKSRSIVTYCSGLSCESSTIAARKLEKFGFTNVLDVKGGLEEWKKAGYPLERS